MKEPEYSFLGPQKIYAPSGLLRFRIRGSVGNLYDPAWSDGKKRPLEEQLNEFVHAIATAAAETKEKRAMWARQEEKRRQAQLEAAAEQSKRSRLLRDAEEWTKVETVRRFLAECERQMAAMPGEPTALAMEWLEWAKGFVSEFDPLCRGIGEYLKPER